MCNLKNIFFSVFRADPFTVTKTFKASNTPQMFQICIDITVKLQGQTVSSSLEFSYQGKTFKMFSTQTPYFLVFLYLKYFFQRHATHNKAEYILKKNEEAVLQQSEKAKSCCDLKPSITWLSLSFCDGSIPYCCYPLQIFEYCVVRSC